MQALLVLIIKSNGYFSIPNLKTFFFKIYRSAVKLNDVNYNYHCQREI